MSQFFLVGVFFLRHSEEVSFDLFNSTIWVMAEKDEDVIALGDVSSLDRQRGERPIFAENVHKVTRRNTEEKKNLRAPSCDFVDVFPFISTLPALRTRPSSREKPSVSVRTIQAEPLAGPPQPADRL